MHNRLSISSFNTFKQLDVIPSRVFFLTLALLVSVRFLLYVNQDSFAKIPPQSDLVPVLSYLDCDYQGKPEVLFFGSSRFISAIKTDLFADRAGIDSTDVLNLAIQSAGPWEALTISRQNLSLLKSVKLAVIEIEPWMFNSNRLNEVLQQPSRPRSHFYRWASLQERLEVADIKTRMTLMLNFFWPLYERHPLKDWMFGISSLFEASHGALAVPLYHYDMEAAQQLANDPHFSTNSAVTSHMYNYKFAENEANNLLRLIQLLEENSIKVILVQPPVRREYMDAIYQDSAYLAAYHNFLSFIRNHVNDDVSVIIWETSAEIGLDDSIFIDYGHFNAKGAEAFTLTVFDKLIETEGKGIFQEQNMARKLY